MIKQFIKKGYIFKQKFISISLALVIFGLITNVIAWNDNTLYLRYEINSQTLGVWYKNGNNIDIQRMMIYLRLRSNININTGSWVTPLNIDPVNKWEVFYIEGFKPSGGFNRYRVNIRPGEYEQVGQNDIIGKPLRKGDFKQVLKIPVQTSMLGSGSVDVYINSTTGIPYTFMCSERDSCTSYIGSGIVAPGNSRVAYLFRDINIYSYTNTAPVLTPVVSNVNLNINQFYLGNVLTGSISDIDSDTLIFSGTSIPNGIRLNPETGVLSGTATTAGTYQTKIFAVDSFGVRSSGEISINFIISSGVRASDVSSGETPEPPQPGEAGEVPSQTGDTGVAQPTEVTTPSGDTEGQQGGEMRDISGDIKSTNTGDKGTEKLGQSASINNYINYILIGSILLILFMVYMFALRKKKK